jgi:hypothetical protein
MSFPLRSIADEARKLPSTSELQAVSYSFASETHPSFSVRWVVIGKQERTGAGSDVVSKKGC